VYLIEWKDQEVKNSFVGVRELMMAYPDMVSKYEGNE